MVKIRDMNNFNKSRLNNLIRLRDILETTGDKTSLSRDELDLLLHQLLPYKTTEDLLVRLNNEIEIVGKRDDSK